MEIVNQEIQSLRHRYDIRVPQEQVEKQIRDRLDSLRKQVKIPGFRSGKVPLSVIQKRYQSKVTQEIVHQTIADCARRLLQETRLTPAQDPTVTAQKLSGDLTFTIEMEVLPTITIPDFSLITLERPLCETTEDLIDKGLNQLADNHRQAHTVDPPRPTRLGDVLTIDYAIAHPAIPRKEGQDVQIRLGDDTLNLGDSVEEQMLNLEIGQTKLIDLTLPEDNYFADYAGESIQLTIVVKEIRVLSEVTLDDSFAQRFDLQTLDELRESVKAQYTREIAQLSYLHLKNQLFNYLERNHMCPLPEQLIEKELGLMWQTYQTQQDLEPMTEERFRLGYRSLAERRIFLAFLIREVGQQRNIQVTSEEISQTLLSYVRSQNPEDAEALYNRLKTNDEVLRQIVAPLLENKVVDAIFSEAILVDKPMSFEELYETKAS